MGRDGKRLDAARTLPQKAKSRNGRRVRQDVERAQARRKLDRRGEIGTRNVYRQGKRYDALKQATVSDDLSDRLAVRHHCRRSCVQGRSANRQRDARLELPIIGKGRGGLNPCDGGGREDAKGLVKRLGRHVDPSNAIGNLGEVGILGE